MRVFIIVLVLIFSCVAHSYAAEKIFVHIDKPSGVKLYVSPVSSKHGVYDWYTGRDMLCRANFVGNSLLNIRLPDGSRVLMSKEDDEIVVSYPDKTRRYDLDSLLGLMYMSAFNHYQKHRY